MEPKRSVANRPYCLDDAAIKSTATAIRRQSSGLVVLRRISKSLAAKCSGSSSPNSAVILDAFSQTSRSDKAGCSGKRGTYTRREHGTPHGHTIGRMWALQRKHVVIAAGEPTLVIVRPQNRNHRLRVYWRNQFVRVACDYREVALIEDVSPETGNREQWLIGHPKPHFPFDLLLAVAKIGRLAPIRRTLSAVSGTGWRDR